MNNSRQKKKETIVFIGAGNVATNLAVELHKRHYTIVQIYSRTEAAAKTLAAQVNATSTTCLETVYREAELYIFSLKDSALLDVLAAFPPCVGMYIHTAGSMPAAVFSPYTDNYGVLYPLQTFTKSRLADFSTIPICLEASGNEQLMSLNKLAKSLSNRVISVNSDKRKYLHLAAVFACNFVNRLYDISAEILHENDLPFDLLLPLIRETSDKVQTTSPFEAQTGPAVRFDVNVMEKQLKLLQHKNFKEIYNLLSHDIHNRHK
ncbi:MAG: DUF2520 domain-containing protein [Bacteroidales bacterium]|jgi:predicted short-subunit dehydrogenase-like oxidoreductase (DUF2520 family)|nr:DUF2520 domain-containing protein [Bacteroidales bacterium]